MITNSKGMIWCLESSWQGKSDQVQESPGRISEVMFSPRPEGEAAINQVTIEREECQADGTACAKALRWKGAR